MKFTAILLLAAFPLLAQPDRLSMLNEYAEMLRIPNVARNIGDMRRNAELIERMYARRGITLTRLEVPGAPPALFGEMRVPGAQRTIILYAHYDGQPVVPNQWSNGGPFEPVLLNQAGQKLPWPTSAAQLDPEWRLQARSASDDKAPIVAFLAALDSGIKPGVNLKFFFDGEEEAGSPHAREILEKYKDRLRADAMIFCDGPVHQSRRQLVSFGVRGTAGFELTIYGPARELHSGHYGNWSPNPALMMAHLIVSMKDEDGRVRVAGFYDDVVPLNEAELRAVHQIPEMEEELKRELLLGAAEVPGKRINELIAIPALNIQGLTSASTGNEARNVIPSGAVANIGIRLVKGMDPRKTIDQFIEHIRRRGYFVVEREPTAAERLAPPRVARVSRTRNGVRSVRVPMDRPLAATVVRAIEKVRGPVIRQPTGVGTLPIAPFEDVLGIPVIIVPIANHDNKQHSHDENIRLRNLWDGVVTLGAVMSAEY